MRKGFTIVELLIAVVVIAILAAITVVVYNGITDKAQEAAIQSELSQFNKNAMAKEVETGTKLCPSWTCSLDRRNDTLEWLNANAKLSFSSTERISTVLMGDWSQESFTLYAVSRAGKVYSVSNSGKQAEESSGWHVNIINDDDEYFAGTVGGDSFWADSCSDQEILVFDTERGVWRFLWHPYAGC